MTSLTHEALLLELSCRAMTVRDGTPLDVLDRVVIRAQQVMVTVNGTTVFTDRSPGFQWWFDWAWAKADPEPPPSP